MSEQAESILAGGPITEAAAASADHVAKFHEDKIGKVCGICTDAEPFDEKTKAITWTDPDGAAHWAHSGCFHRARADEQVKLLKNTQEVLACLLAAWGGTVKITPAHIQRAIAAGFQFSQEECPRAGGFRLRLGDKLPDPPKPPPPALPPEQLEQIEA